MPCYQILQNHAQHAALLSTLFAQCPDWFTLADGEPASRASVQETLAETPPGHTLQQKRVFALADASGQLTAVLEALRDYPRAGIWYLGLLLVRPDCRQKNLGSQLFRLFAQHARQQGANEIRLCIFQENPGARSFWEKQGFIWSSVLPEQPFGQKRHVRDEFCLHLA